MNYVWGVELREHACASLARIPRAFRASASRLARLRFQFSRTIDGDTIASGESFLHI